MRIFPSTTGHRAADFPVKHPLYALRVEGSYSVVGFRVK